MKIDIVKDDGDCWTWKQVERRDGLTFMRMKRVSKTGWLSDGAQSV